MPAQSRVDAAASRIGEPVDIPVVPGSLAWDEMLEDEELLDALRSATQQSKWIASVCAGSFLLAAIGLLDDRAPLLFLSAARTT